MRLVQNSAGNAQSLLEKSSTALYAISNPFGDRSIPSQSVCEFYFILFYFNLIFFFCVLIFNFILSFLPEYSNQTKYYIDIRPLKPKESGNI